MPLAHSADNTKTIGSRVSQLSLFDESDGAASAVQGTSPPAADVPRLEQAYREARDVATRLPASMRFGTSSWSFPGWKGIVYERDLPQTSLSREGLREYARHPLLRTVGIDRSYYAPIPIDDLKRYADQLPAGFPCCMKAPAGVTATFVGGRGAPLEPNPAFLSAGRFIEEVLEPCALVFRGHTGPFIFECPALPREAPPDAAMFIDKLDAMFDRLPRAFRYAVELRDRSRLTAEYGQVLRRHGVAHTYNYWSDMPMPLRQADTVGPGTAPFVVIRLLLRPGTLVRGVA